MVIEFNQKKKIFLLLTFGTQIMFCASKSMENMLEVNFLMYGENSIPTYRVLSYLYYYYAVHGFAKASYDVHEGETLATTFEMNVKGSTDSQNLTIEGNVITEADTARMFVDGNTSTILQEW